MTSDANDETYATASGKALGRSLLGIFEGMIEHGQMSRAEALEVVSAYAAGLASASDIQLDINIDEAGE